MFKVQVESFCISISKRDEIYYFSTKDFSGKSKLPELKVENFQENFQEYLDYVSLDIQSHGAYLVLTLPVPFSSKTEVVRLNQRSGDLAKSIALACKRVSVKYDHLCLMYDVVKGYYLDYATCLREGGNAKNIELFRRMIDDQLGFNGIPVSYNKAMLSNAFKSSDDFLMGLRDFDVKCVNKEWFFWNLIGCEEDMFKRKLLTQTLWLKTTSSHVPLHEAMIGLDIRAIPVIEWTIPKQDIEYIMIPQNADSRELEANVQLQLLSKRVSVTRIITNAVLYLLY